MIFYKRTFEIQALASYPACLSPSIHEPLHLFNHWQSLPPPAPHHGSFPLLPSTPTHHHGSLNLCMLYPLSGRHFFTSYQSPFNASSRFGYPTHVSLPSQNGTRQRCIELVLISALDPTSLYCYNLFTCLSPPLEAELLESLCIPRDQHRAWHRADIPWMFTE